jgi:hypothetical protein
VGSGDPVTVMYIISKICRAIHTDDPALPEHPRERGKLPKRLVKEESRFFILMFATHFHPADTKGKPMNYDHYYYPKLK